MYDTDSQSLYKSEILADFFSFVLILTILKLQSVYISLKK